MQFELVQIRTPAALPYNWKARSQRRLSIVYGLPPCYSFVYVPSMASALEKTKNTGCRVLADVVTTLTNIKGVRKRQNLLTLKLPNWLVLQFYLKILFSLLWIQI